MAEVRTNQLFMTTELGGDGIKPQVSECSPGAVNNQGWTDWADPDPDINVPCSAASSTSGAAPKADHVPALAR